MSTDPSSRSSGREMLLTILLSTLAIGGFFVFFLSIMGVFVLHALLLFVVLAVFGFGHWLLWGRAMTNETALEREEQEESPKLPPIGYWPDDDRYGPRRM
jgi:quinol-cytochrome oxidoreductase complex cytochrome b subunit